MNFKRYFSHLNQFFIDIIILVVSFLLLLSFTVSGNESSYQLTKIAELEHRLISQPKWQQLIANPSNKQQYFVIRESGQVYLIDNDKIDPQAILDMSVVYNINPSIFKLTAIALHPNFSLRNQDGYGTFYTAHIESLDTKSKTKRIQERSDDFQLTFDAVITEWQFNAVDRQKVNVKTKREVLRIGLPDNNIVIKQMSFSPYAKSWNENFGLLYIALDGDKKWTKPLYSGVILRINPAKFGLRSFTLPNNNLYMKNSEINSAIHLLGGQKIIQFIWAGKNSEHLLVSHQYDNQYLLSLTDGRNDWRASKGQQVLYQGGEAIQDMLVYQGRDLPLLRSKLLLLRKKKKDWFVDSLAFNSTDSEAIRDEKKPRQEWSITSQKLGENSQIILSRSYNGEILLLDKAINNLFRISPQALLNNNIVNEGIDSSIEKSSTNYNTFILVLILVLFGAAYYWFKRNGNSVKKIVHTQFASFELSESNQRIKLYHKHENKAGAIIDIVDIISSEVELNEQNISIINKQSDHGFVHNKEQDLRTIFVKEKVDKMVDGKTRQISLLLTDVRNNNYTICLYMRRGSNRLTKKPYVKVINELIDWCWYISEKINASNTGKRKIKPAVLLESKVETSANKENELPLHHQAAAIRPKNHSIEIVEQESNISDNQIPQKNSMDTDLVNALEKLVNLQQQGFLTMDEFSKAKEKLLKTLFEK